MLKFPNLVVKAFDVLILFVKAFMCYVLNFLEKKAFMCFIDDVTTGGGRDNLSSPTPCVKTVGSLQSLSPASKFVPTSCRKDRDPLLRVSVMAIIIL